MSVPRQTWTARLLPKRTRKLIAAAMVLGAAMLTAAIAIGWLLARAEPAGLVHVDAQSPETLTLGRAVEDGISTLMSQARKPDAAAGGGSGKSEATWTMTLDERSASAWLATRLRPWLLSRTTLKKIPAQLGRVAVRFADERIVLFVELLAGKQVEGAKAEVPGGFGGAAGFEMAESAPAQAQAEMTTGARWLTVSLHTRTVDQRLFITLMDVGMGKLTLPATTESLALALTPARSPRGVYDRLIRSAMGPSGIQAVAQADEVLAERGMSVADLVLGLQPIGPAELKLPDGRRVLIDGMEPENGVLTIRCRTVGAR